MSDLRTSILKLNNDNYSSWCFYMKSYLVIEGLWDLIEQDLPDIEDADWTKRDQIARAKINLLVDDSQIQYIMKARTAKDAWVALRIQHEKCNSKLLTFRKLCQLKLVHNGDIEDHIAKFTRHVQELQILGLILPDIVVSSLMMASLPNSSLDLILDVEKMLNEEGINVPYKRVFDMVLERLNKGLKDSKTVPRSPSKQYHNAVNRSRSSVEAALDRLNIFKDLEDTTKSPRQMRNKC